MSSSFRGPHPHRPTEIRDRAGPPLADLTRFRPSHSSIRAVLESADRTRDSPTPTGNCHLPNEALGSWERDVEGDAARRPERYAMPLSCVARYQLHNRPRAYVVSAFKEMRRVTWCPPSSGPTESRSVRLRRTTPGTSRPPSGNGTPYVVCCLRAYQPSNMERARRSCWPLNPGECGHAIARSSRGRYMASGDPRSVPVEWEGCSSARQNGDRAQLWLLRASEMPHATRGLR
jgi:hypothetical protein